MLSETPSCSGYVQALRHNPGRTTSSTSILQIASNVPAAAVSLWALPCACGLLTIQPEATGKDSRHTQGHPLLARASAAGITTAEASKNSFNQQKQLQPATTAAAGNDSRSKPEGLQPSTAAVTSKDSICGKNSSVQRVRASRPQA